MVQCINHKDREAVTFYGMFGCGVYVCKDCYKYYQKESNKQFIKFIVYFNFIILNLICFMGIMGVYFQ